jgi:hypothetical protein
MVMSILPTHTNRGIPFVYRQVWHICIGGYGSEAGR